jgi:hypothetical protein
MEGKWMSDQYGIVLVVVAVGVAIWALMRLSRNSRKNKPKDTPQTHRDRAVWAWARIITSTHGAVGLGGMLRVTLELEIHLPGTPQYVASTIWLVEQEMLEYVETGKEISLKVDPLDLKYIYPNGSWAKVVE